MSEQPVITYSEARAAGLKRYFTGKPCKHGHMAERMLPSTNCVECQNIRNASVWTDKREVCQAQNAAWRAANAEYLKEYREANKERQKASTLAWREKNPERFAASCVAWNANNKDYMRIRDAARYAANPEKGRAHSRAYRIANPDKIVAGNNNRRARIAAAEGTHTSADVREIRKLQKNKCAYCRASLRGGAHLDHIMPLALGGSNYPKNLQFLCKPCNLTKHVKHPIDFARQIGRLV